MVTTARQPISPSNLVSQRPTNQPADQRRNWYQRLTSQSSAVCQRPTDLSANQALLVRTAHQSISQSAQLYTRDPPSDQPIKRFWYQRSTNHAPLVPTAHQTTNRPMKSPVGNNNAPINHSTQQHTNSPPPNQIKVIPVHSTRTAHQNPHQLYTAIKSTNQSALRLGLRLM